MPYAEKVAWLDVETTGLDPVKQDVIQVAGIIEIGGNVMEEFEFKCQPHSFENIENRALEVHGYNREDLKRFELPIKAKNQIEAIFSKYVGKYDKTDKFTMAGYNVPFDYKFMKQFWLKCGDKYWGSFINYKLMDIYPLFELYCRVANVTLPNHKLVTAAEYFGLDFDSFGGAHDAMGDIRVTREICNIMGADLKRGIDSRGHGYDREPDNQVL